MCGKVLCSWGGVFMLCKSRKMHTSGRTLERLFGGPARNAPSSLTVDLVAAPPPFFSALKSSNARTSGEVYHYVPIASFCSVSPGTNMWLRR